jgi:hypothetical protein
LDDIINRLKEEIMEGWLQPVEKQSKPSIKKYL